MIGRQVNVSIGFLDSVAAQLPLKVLHERHVPGPVAAAMCLPSMWLARLEALSSKGLPQQQLPASAGSAKRGAVAAAPGLNEGKGNLHCSSTVCSALNSSCFHTQAAPSGERELLYEDFMKEKEKKEREAKKAERRRRMAAFRQLLENTKSVRVRAANALKH